MNYFLITFFCLLCFTSCQEAPSSPQVDPEVTIITVERKNIPAVIEYVGMAQSSHLVEIRARVDGYLQKIAYKEGDAVKTGDLLFQIDPTSFEATLAQSKGVEAEQEAGLWRAQRALERFTPLYSQKAASLRDLDNATAEVLASKALVEAAKARVLQAEINLGYTTIRSPISGVSNRARYREGALVGPGSEQSLLTTIYVLDPIWADFNVSEGDILKYREMNQKGHFEFPKDMNFEIEVIFSDSTVLPAIGKVDFADPVLEQSTGSMSVRAIIDNPDHLLMPGQFIRARLRGAFYPNTISVPQKAVMQGAKGLFVYVVNQESKAEMRNIVGGDWHDDDWIIQSGLEVGERVMVDGINKVLPGMKVNIQDGPVP